MAIIDVKRMWSTGGITRSVSGLRVTQTATIGYTVLFDSASPQNEYDALTGAGIAAGIPAEGAVYPADTSGKLVCIGKNAKALGPVLYTVMCDYRFSYSAALHGDEPESEPTNQPWEFNIAFVRSTEQVDVDATGTRLTNINGEPFDPPLTRDVYDTMAIISRVDSLGMITVAKEYVGSVNLNAVTLLGAVPGRARLVDLQTRPEHIQDATGVDTVYWRSDYHIALRYDLAPDTLPAQAWYWRIAHTGFKEWTGVGGEDARFQNLVNIKDANGADVVTPALLDANGQALAANSATHWIYRQRYIEKDWTPLGFT